MKNLKIGVVVADEWEFVPLKKWASKFCIYCEFNCTNETIKFNFNKNIEVVCVKCGIGKVNASFAASYLIFDEKCDIILNIGLSGAINNVKKGDIVAGSEYIECDFDLTAIGRQPGEKPDQIFLYPADKKLLSLAKNCRINCFKRLGTGDIFLADKNLKNYYKSVFDICAFDMESAAIAAVCHKTKIPHLSVRKISDDCEEGAAESYNELNVKAEIHLSEVLEDILQNVTENY